MDSVKNKLAGPRGAVGHGPVGQNGPDSAETHGWEELVFEFLAMH